MSQVMVLSSDGSALCSCNDCGGEFIVDELDMISDFEDRVSAGEETPAGECPECGGLAHLKDPPKWSAAELANRHGAALRQIIDARDYHAKHGEYQKGTLAADQCFDDWAADLAQKSLTPTT